MTEYSEEHWNKLIDQYQKGTISSTDRFALEKRALDDPFLFDALEGYALMEDEDEIPNKTKSKIFTLPRLATAASLVFLVSMIFLMKEDKSIETAQNDKVAMALPEEGNKSLQDEDVLQPKKKTEAPIDSKKNDANTPKRKTSENTVEQKLPVNQQSKKNNQSSKAPKSTKESAVAIDEKSNQSSDVSIESDLEKASDIEATQDMPATASQEEVEYETAANTNENILLPDTDAVADITLSSELDKNIESKKKSAPSLFYVVEPLIGKRDFDEYAQQRINQRSDLKQNPSQEIVIEFSIDKNGEIGNFVHITEQGTCSACGSFAINILQNSGVWRTVPAGNEGRARYSFNF
jgi:hypothetical protein